MTMNGAHAGVVMENDNRYEKYCDFCDSSRPYIWKQKDNGRWGLWDPEYQMWHWCKRTKVNRTEEAVADFKEDNLTTFSKRKIDLNI